jgi:multiple sugar transport system permease protein
LAFILNPKRGALFMNENLYMHGKNYKRDLIHGLLFTSPVILGYAVFVLVPLIMTIVLGFTDFSLGAPKTNFVGLKNFIDMFRGNDVFFYPSVKATLYYVFASVPLGIVFSLFIAVLLNKNIKGRGLLRGAFYLPVVIPLASSSIIWMWMMQPDFGVINYFLKCVGLSPSPWLASDKTVIPAFILMSLWLSGNTIVIFLAALQEVPTQLYEAIEVDGGNFLHKFAYITIPMISPIIFFNTVMGFINGFQTFVQPMIMTSGAVAQTAGNMGGPNNASLLYVLYIYQHAFRYSKMGAASAGSFLLFLIILVFTALFFKTSKSLVYYEGDGKQR